MSVSSDHLRFILGLKLRTLRREQGASLKEVAERSGLSVSYLSEIEKGKKYPKPDKIVDLADALGVTYDDLVSLSVKDDLSPLKDVFSSDFVEEFPFEVFGLASQDVFSLVSDEPERAGALIRTFLEVGRNYDMQVEHFLFAALRSYQQMHGNYFADLEAAAASFRERQGWTDGRPPSHDTLRDLLVTEYGYDVDLGTLADHPELSGFRTVYVDGSSPTLVVNGDLMPIQQAFIFAREIGYCELGIEERPRTSSWLRIESFDQLLNNFRASYFAGAVIMDRAALLQDLETMFAEPTWAPERVRSCMDRYNATPEMLLYRLTELVPNHFGIDDFFFLRFYHEPGSPDFQLNKILNLSDVPVPHGVGLNEHYCQRWPAIKLLQELEQEQENGPLTTQPSEEPRVRAQRSYFLNEEAEYFVLSVARPLALQPETNSCVSIGFLMNDAFKERVACWRDDAIPQVDVNLTCERCPLPQEDCTDRVAPPSIYEEEQAQRRTVEAVEELQAAFREG
jgi:transcriptional regulator with XRE-family HTH domain